VTRKCREKEFIKNKFLIKINSFSLHFLVTERIAFPIKENKNCHISNLTYCNVFQAAAIVLTNMLDFDAVNIQGAINFSEKKLLHREWCSH